MPINRSNPRGPSHDVDAQFIDRWSPRSFAADELTDAQFRALMEAARWAPSCSNEQPWIVWAARTAAARERLARILAERNRLWAGHAPLLLLIGARRSFAQSGSPNRHAGFDAGAAWMSLALQARRLGLHAHGMAGFDLDKAYELTGVKRDDCDIFAAVAVGRRGPAERLPEEMRPRETPNGRRELAEFVIELPE